MLVPLLYLIFIIVPGSLFLHELGHLIGAKLMKSDAIQLIIGSGKELAHFSYKNISITINTLLFFGALTKSKRRTAYTTGEKISIAISGPISSGLFGCVFYILYLYFPNTFIYLLSLFNFWLAISNLCPIKVGKKQSDGYTVYKMILKRYTSSI